MKKILLTITAIYLLTGCGGNSAKQTIDSQISKPKTPKEKAELIEIGKKFKADWKRLEDEGKIIKLDRSKSLLGTDANNDGIRDDIREVIDKLAREEGLKPKEVRAVEQSAKSLQSMLDVNLSNEASILKQIDIEEKELACMFLLDKDDDKIWNLYKTIKSKTLNTRERTYKYFAYDKAMSGRVFGDYEGKENPCE